MTDASRSQYWDDYSNLQHVKHRLIHEYLNGWFPKLGSWAGRILYVDTHAGRGRHASGHEGSPLVALRTFLEHKHRERILRNCEVRFVFMEENPEHLSSLESELATLVEQEPLSRGVTVDPYGDDFHTVMQESLDALRAAGRRMAPAFVFVDPHGFSLSYRVLRDLMGFAAVELFVNVMWRELNMEIRNAREQEGAARLLDFMFDGPTWREKITAPGTEERCDETLSFIVSLVGAKWGTSVRMLGKNRVTRYVLLHLTNSDVGRDLMKTTMWKVCDPVDGTFLARKTDDPGQGVLLKPDPDSGPLADWLRNKLRHRPMRYADLESALREELWLNKHLAAVVREGRVTEDRKDGWLQATDYKGRFSAKANPLLRLTPGASRSTAAKQ